jgi:hypothetical protein
VPVAVAATREFLDDLRRRAAPTQPPETHETRRVPCQDRPCSLPFGHPGVHIDGTDWWANKGGTFACPRCGQSTPHVHPAAAARAPAAHGESATGEAALAAPGDGFRPWKEEAIRWFGQLRDICKGASVGGDTMADTVGLCAWAIKLLRAGNAASPPVPVAWGGAAARAATVKESDHG